jgi:hypothetical protein
MPYTYDANRCDNETAKRLDCQPLVVGRPNLLQVLLQCPDEGGSNQIPPSGFLSIQKVHLSHDRSLGIDARANGLKKNAVGYLYVRFKTRFVSYIQGCCPSSKLLITISTIHK